MLHCFWAWWLMGMHKHCGACLQPCHEISVMVMFSDPINNTVNSCALFISSLILFGRVMMRELNTDLAYTSTPLSKRRQHKILWNGSRSFWRGRLLLRFCLWRNSSELRSTTSSTLRKGGVSDLSNLLKKAVMILLDAMAKFVLSLNRQTLG